MYNNKAYRSVDLQLLYRGGAMLNELNFKLRHSKHENLHYKKYKFPWKLFMALGLSKPERDRDPRSLAEVDLDE